MHYQTVFEVTDKNFSFMSCIPLVFTVWSIVVIWLNKKFGKDKSKSKAGFRILWIVFGLSLGISLLVIPISMKNQFQIKREYQRGNYTTIEGQITNFDPMPEEGHKHESFTLNGIHFEYSDFEPLYGFNNSASHGGPIRENGQQVRLGYVTELKRNIIVKIEVLKEP